MSGAYFEDINVGDTRTEGAEVVDEATIIRFGKEWDPQPFHIDPDAARESVFGGLVASGLQTIAVTYRLFLRTGWTEGTALAGLGFENVRFLKPVYAGDTLTATITVTNKRASKRKDGGLVTWAMESRNQKNELVFTFSITVLIAVRP